MEFHIYIFTHLFLINYAHNVLLSRGYNFHLIIWLWLLEASDRIFYPLLFYVQNAIWKNLSRVFNDCNDLDSILDDNSGIKLIRNFWRLRAIGIVSLTFPQDHLAEKQASSIHEAHSRQVREVDAMAKQRHLVPGTVRFLIQTKVVFHDFVDAFIGSSVK